MSLATIRGHMASRIIAQPWRRWCDTCTSSISSSRRCRSTICLQRPTGTPSRHSDHGDPTAMNKIDAIMDDLVIANRILAHEDVVDAYGHVSIRHPDKPNHFFLARSLAPELVTRDDIVEFGMDGEPVRDEKRPLYLERFIHAGILDARPDVMAVVHAHAEDILPFGIATDTPLRPVIHAGSFIGPNVPVWDIAEKFGDTNVLVTNMDQGRDLARVMDGNPVGLMRGHGFASCARSLIEVVRVSVYLPRNARALMRAK